MHGALWNVKKVTAHTIKLYTPTPVMAGTKVECARICGRDSAEADNSDDSDNLDMADKQ